MKLLIALLTAATGILHLLAGFGLVPPSDSMFPLLIANGVGYLVLLALFFTSSGSRRGTIRWILLLYTLITLVGYFIIGEGFGGGTIPLVIKAIELLLIIMLFLDRGSDRVVAPATTPTTTRMRPGYDTSPTPMGSGAAVAAAGGAAGLGDRSVVAASETLASAEDVVLDTAESAVDEVDYVSDKTDDAWDATIDTVAETTDYAEGKTAAAWDVATETTADTADYIEDETQAAWDDATDTVVDTVDTIESETEAAWDDTTDTVEGAAGMATAAGTAAAYTSEDVAETLDVVDDTARDTAGMGADMGDMAAVAAEPPGYVVDGATSWVGDTSMEMESAEPSVDELRAELEDYLLSFGPTSEFRKPIEYIEGIGDSFGQKLRDLGVVTVLDLMVHGATRRGRAELSAQSGIAQSSILTWVNHIDLFRIKGIAQQFAELLEESGVDTVMELAQRNPVNLHKRMTGLNEQRGLVRRTPHLSEVEDWVQQAKGLRRLITY